MLTLKKLLAHGAIAAMLATAATAAFTAPASAYVVCGRHGNCHNVQPHRRFMASYYGDQGGYYGPAYYGPQYGPTVAFGVGFGDRDRMGGNRDDRFRGGRDRAGRGDGTNGGDRRDNDGRNHRNR